MRNTQALPRIYAHPRWQLVCVPGDAAYALSEREHRVIPQPNARRFISAWQESEETTLDAVVQRLVAEGMNAALAYHVFGQLKSRGFLIEATDAPTLEDKLWAELEAVGGLQRDGETAAFMAAAPSLHDVRTVPHVRFLGELAQPYLEDAVRHLDLPVASIRPWKGIRPEAKDAPLLVVTDDYLRPELGEIDRHMRAAGRPWMLAKPVGSVLWWGPVLRPDDPSRGCWHCLSHRLYRNREVEGHLAHHLGRSMPLVTYAGHTRESLGLGMALAIDAFHRDLAQDTSCAHVHTRDLALGEVAEHHLVRRPQCLACGDGGKHSLASRPITLACTPKRFTVDGGHRSRDPEATWQRFRHHVSPITGAVSYLVPYDAKPVGVSTAAPNIARTGDGDEADAPVPLHNYVAGHNFAVGAPGLAGLKAGLRSKSAGKGMTAAQARASGLAEALERYSGIFMGEEPRRRARFVDFAEGEALDPRRCMLFSERQYAERESWRARGSSFQYVPDPFDEDAGIEWSPVWSLTEERHKYLPTSYLYYAHPEGGRFCTGDSNGSAAGNTREEAILQGFFELVERDAVAVWWYNRLKRPRVDIDSFDLDYAHRLEPFLRRHAREFHVLDLTHDFGIPVFGAVTRRFDKKAEDIVFAFGAHFDARIALTRALTEMCQFLPAVLHMPADGSGRYGFDDPHSIHWWQHATFADQPYLLPDEELPVRRADDFSWAPREDIAEDVRHGQRLVEERGMEMLVLDQTRPDIGLHVVKVIVPGMRHFWARFAPGRLYEVPVAMGWTKVPLQEERLNPIPMFI